MLDWLKIWRRPEETFQFLHIPKTAGTSLSHLLSQQFASEKICPASHWTSFIQLPQESLDQYRLFQGHLYYFLHQYLGFEPVTFTFLRDPVQRTISHYTYILRHPTHSFYNRVKELGTFRAFLEDPESCTMISDLQTRMLGLDLDPQSINNELGHFQGQQGELEKRILSHMVPEEEREAFLNRAIERLEGLAFVGLVEHYDESVQQMCRQFGWKAPEQSPQLNVAPKHSRINDISDSERRLLRKHLELDEALYAHALKMLRSDQTDQKSKKVA